MRSRSSKTPGSDDFFSTCGSASAVERFRLFEHPVARTRIAAEATKPQRKVVLFIGSPLARANGTSTFVRGHELRACQRRRGPVNVGATRRSKLTITRDDVSAGRHSG